MDVTGTWVLILTVLVTAVPPLSTMVDKGHLDTMTDNTIQRGFMNVEEESPNIRGENIKHQSQPINDLPSSVVSLTVPSNENSAPSPTEASNNPSDITQSTVIEVTSGSLKTLTRKSRRRSSRRTSRRSRKNTNSPIRTVAEVTTDTKVDGISKGNTVQTAPRPTTTSDNVIAGSTRRPSRRSRRQSKRRSRRRRSRRPTTPLPLNTNREDQIKENGNIFDRNTSDTSKSTKHLSSETSNRKSNITSDSALFTTKSTPRSDSQPGSLSGSMSTMIYTTLLPGERTIAGKRFQEQGSMLTSGSSTETVRIFTEPFRNELITASPVLEGSTTDVHQTSSKTSDTLPPSSNINLGNAANSEAQKMSNMLVKVGDHHPDTSAMNLNWKKSTMNTENHIINAVSNISTPEKSSTTVIKTLEQTEAPIDMVSKNSASNNTSVISTTNKKALSPSSLLSGNNLNVNLRPRPMSLTSLLARLLFPRVLGPSNVIVQTRRPDRTVMRNEDSVISSRRLTPLLTTTRRRPRIILIQPQDLSFYRKRVLCSETPRRLRKPCINKEDCRHKMECYLGRCCATSDRHAEILENLLERLDMRRLRRFR